MDVTVKEVKVEFTSKEREILREAVENPPVKRFSNVSTRDDLVKILQQVGDALNKHWNNQDRVLLLTIRQDIQNMLVGFDEIEEVGEE